MLRGARIRDELKKEYYDLLKVRYNKCLEPTETCTSKAINAHSMQNARVLDLLCDNGHVCTYGMKYRNDTLSLCMERIGRNKATTFKGLCSIHDPELFRPIDTNKVDSLNREHLFLIAYRSVLKELHAITQNAITNQMAYLSAVRRGSIPGDKPTPIGVEVTMRLGFAHDTYVYKKKFDAALLRGRYGEIGHTVLRFADLAPTIAASALYSLDDIEWPDDVARVALNVFPDNEGTSVIFSYLEEERPYVMEHLNRLLSATDEYQRYLISKIILQNCENFVIAPKYFDEWTEEKRLAVEKFYVHTMHKNDHAYENEHLYLF